MKENKKKKCSNCGKEIEDTYLMILDNYLQVNYFDSEEENCFCSKECLLEALSVEEMEEDEEE